MKRGEIWYINLDPSIGQEIKKTRPCIIVNDDAIGILSLRVIVPLTDWKEHYHSADWMVKIESDSNNKLIKTSAADCFQVRSLSTNRLLNQSGYVSERDMIEIEKALCVVLKIKSKEYPEL